MPAYSAEYQFSGSQFITINTQKINNMMISENL